MTNLQAYGIPVSKQRYRIVSYRNSSEGPVHRSNNFTVLEKNPFYGGEEGMDISWNYTI